MSWKKMSRNILFNKFLMFILFNILIIVFYLESDKYIRFDGYMSSLRKSLRESDKHKEHRRVIRTYYDKRKKWETSNLGAVLFKNADPDAFLHSSNENKTFVIHLWRYWDWLKKRHAYNFDSKGKNDSINVLEGCSVQNCILTHNDEQMNKADAVIIHMQRGVFPKLKNRNLEQRWIFLSDESPENTFSLADDAPFLSDLGNVFNWTMTYRSDADIPVPYGRTVPLEDPLHVDMSNTNSALNRLVPYWREKQRLRAMILYSHCTKDRKRFIATIRNYVEVDVFGRCSEENENKKVCPGYFTTDCDLPIYYLFYLVLENSRCRQYLTEKAFQHAYSKGAIPIIMGPYLEDCKRLLPPNSFLHVDNFKSVNDLAKHIAEIARDKKQLLSYHAWRQHFQVVNEHGFFKTKSYHFCRVCEALNYNLNRRKMYDEDDLRIYFDKYVVCESFKISFKHNI